MEQTRSSARTSGLSANCLCFYPSVRCLKMFEVVWPQGRVVAFPKAGPNKKIKKNKRWMFQGCSNSVGSVAVSNMLRTAALPPRVPVSPAAAESSVEVHFGLGKIECCVDWSLGAFHQTHSFLGVWECWNVEFLGTLWVFADRLTEATMKSEQQESSQRPADFQNHFETRKFFTEKELEKEVVYHTFRMLTDINIYQ